MSEEPYDYYEHVLPHIRLTHSGYTSTKAFPKPKGKGKAGGVPTIICALKDGVEIGRGNRCILCKHYRIHPSTLMRRMKSGKLTEGIQFKFASEMDKL